LLNSKPIYLTGLLSLLMLVSVNALAHGVDDNTRNFLQQNTGVQLIPFMYIGAKHMLTGYDHLLFLVGGHLFSIQKPGGEHLLTNTSLMSAGLTLMAYQLTGFTL